MSAAIQIGSIWLAPDMRVIATGAPPRGVMPCYPDGYPDSVAMPTCFFEGTRNTQNTGNALSLIMLLQDKVYHTCSAPARMIVKFITNQLAVRDESAPLPPFCPELRFRIWFLRTCAFVAPEKAAAGA